MENIVIPIEAIFYLKISAACLVVVAVCRVLECIQTMRIKAVDLDTANIQRESAHHQKQLILEAIAERQNRK